MNRLLFIQNALDEAVSTSSFSSQTAETKINLLEMTIKGGWVMIPIFLLFFVAMGIVIERILVIRKVSKKENMFMDRIRDYIHEGNTKSAEKLCQRTNTLYAHMIKKGIQYLEHPANDVLIVMENVGRIEIAKLEKGFVWIASAAAIAPMLGFFGTVTGMVRAFFDMANAGSNIDISLLSTGIYQALVTTVAGLSVGIPALFAYNYLISMIDHLTVKMENLSMDFINVLIEKNVYPKK